MPRAADTPESPAAAPPTRNVVNVVTGASLAGRRRLRLLALTRTDSAALAPALDEVPRRCTGGRAAARQAAVIAEVRAALAYDPTRERAVAERDRGRAALRTLDGLPDLYTTALLRRAAEERGWLDHPHDLAAMDAVRGAPGRDVAALGAYSPDHLAVAAAEHLASIRAAWPQAPDPALAAMPEERLREVAAERAARQQQMAAWRRRGDDEDRPLTPAERRQCCPRWQRRKLRRECARSRQWWSAALGTVGRGAAPYADGYSVARWQERQDHAREWAEAHVLRWEDGTEASLADVQRASGEAQVARLYAMLRGLDDLAVREGRGTAIMITLTLPPEWHPSPAVGERTWTPERSPEHADRDLQKRWARLRALLHAAGLPPLGLRVVEPHRDGCPHLHALLYLPPPPQHG